MEVAHRPLTETTVDDLSRVLRWFDESTAEELRELTSRHDNLSCKGRTSALEPLLGWTGLTGNN